MSRVAFLRPVRCATKYCDRQFFTTFDGPDAYCERCRDHRAAMGQLRADKQAERWAEWAAAKSERGSP